MTQSTDQVSSTQLPYINILGNRVHMVELPDAARVMDRWIETEPHRCHHVVNSGMHGIMEGYRDSGFQAILKAADLFAPDGILVVLIARIRGHRLRKKNTGPELLWEFSKIADQKGYRFFFYGDTEDTLQQLAARLKESFPGLEIAGLNSPPFRPLTPEEDAEAISAINDAKPHVLWVGLGMPKQERWISEHRDRLRVPVVVGAGASLKFTSGNTERAPAWLRNWGFEWMWRLFQEPTRVWRRVFIDAPQFLGLVALELAGLKKYGGLDNGGR